MVTPLAGETFRPSAHFSNPSESTDLAKMGKGHFVIAAKPLLFLLLFESSVCGKR